MTCWLFRWLRDLCRACIFELEQSGWHLWLGWALEEEDRASEFPSQWEFKALCLSAVSVGASLVSVPLILSCCSPHTWSFWPILHPQQILEPFAYSVIQLLLHSFIHHIASVPIVKYFDYYPVCTSYLNKSMIEIIHQIIPSLQERKPGHRGVK